jgi:hypothetical protein
MPYLPLDRKQELNADPIKATEPGDFNYLFTMDYLREWLTPGKDRYFTIDEIVGASRSFDHRITKKTEDMLISLLPDAVNKYATIGKAKKAAFDEFRRRVVDPYEEYCIAKNGDILEYQQAELLLDSRYGE